MNEIELKEYLKKNLKINILVDVNIYNELEAVRVKLLLDEVVISEDKGFLYNKNTDDYRMKGYNLYR